MIIIDKNYISENSKRSRQTHLNLNESCLERGGNSVNHRGVLAQYLNTTIPSGRILLCHACHNSKCSNPKHLYWGSDSENYQDAISNGATSFYERTVNKYGYDFIKKNAMNAGKASGESRKKLRLELTDEHKANISKQLKGRKLSDETKLKMSLAAKNRRTSGRIG